MFSFVTFWYCSVKNYVNREDFAQYREIYPARRGAN